MPSLPAIGIAATTYNGNSTIYEDVKYLQNVAPLERVLISTTIDKDWYLSTISGQYPGNLDSNLTGVKYIFKQGSNNTPTESEINNSAITLPPSNVQDELDGGGNEVKVAQLEVRVPGEWANSTWTISTIWIFSYSDTTDYFVIPVDIQVREFQDKISPGSRDLDILSIEDQDGNTLPSLLICYEDGVEEIHIRYQLNAGSPGNFNLIPLISIDGSDAYSENDVYPHSAMNQLTDTRVISNSETFDSGTGQGVIVLDADQFRDGRKYCITAIAKDGAMSDPDQPSPTCSTTITYDFTFLAHAFNQTSFLLELRVDNMSVPGGSVQSISIDPMILAVGNNTNVAPLVPVYSAGTAFLIEEQEVGWSGSTNSPSEITVTVQYIITVVVDFGSGNICTYNSTIIDVFTLPPQGKELTHSSTNTHNVTANPV